jgi:hypothetical protein
MNFKDKRYYVGKLKGFLGLALTAVLFDMIVAFIIIVG